MSTEPLGDTIQPLTLSDTVYTWYNTTNEIIDLVNPLNIYDVVPENGISYTRSGISDGTLTFSVNLKNTGGLIFDNITGGIRLSTQNLTLESFASASSYKLFAEDSAGNIKAVSFDLNAGTGISFDDNTGSMTIGVNDDVVLLTKVQTLTNKSLVAPKIVNSVGSSQGITLIAPANIQYSLTLPTSNGSTAQVLRTDGNGVLYWSDAASGSGGGIFNFRADGDSSNISLNLDNYLIIEGGAGITTTSTSGTNPKVSINIDNTVVTTTAAQFLSNKRLVAPRIYNSTTSSRYIGIEASSTIPSSYNLILPTTPGSNGQFLRTDGTGILTWASITTSEGGGAIFTIAADTGSTPFNTETDTLTVTGGIGISTVINTNNEIEINLNRNIFESDGNLIVSTPNGSVRYSLNSTISNITLNNGLFSNINYQYSDIVGEAGPLYTLMGSDWDGTETENGHLIGQLILVPVPEI